MNYFIYKLKNHNIEPVLKKNQCNWVINLYYPNPDIIYNYLSKNNYFIYKCKEKLKNNTRQIDIFNKIFNDIDNIISFIIKVI